MKAEFDSLKNNFQAQIDNYNMSIDSKIDGAIASYLSGIKLSSTAEFDNILKKINIKYPNKNKIFFRMKKENNYDGDTFPIGDESDSWVYGHNTTGHVTTAAPNRIFYYHYSLRVPLQGSVIHSTDGTWVGEGNWECLNKGNYSEGLYAENFNANPHFCPIGSQFTTFSSLTYTLEIGKPFFQMAGLFIGAYRCELSLVHDIDEKNYVDYWVGGTSESTNENLFNMDGKNLTWSNSKLTTYGDKYLKCDMDSKAEDTGTATRPGYCLYCGCYNTYTGGGHTGITHDSSLPHYTSYITVKNYTAASPAVRTVYIPRSFTTCTTNTWKQRTDATSWKGTMTVYDNKLTTTDVYGPQGSSTYINSWSPDGFIMRNTWGVCYNTNTSGNTRIIIPEKRKSYRSYYEKQCSNLTESIKMDNGFPIVKSEQNGKVKLTVKTDVPAVWSAWCGDTGCTNWNGLRSTMEAYTSTQNKIAANTSTEIVIDNVEKDKIVYLVMTPQSSSAKGVNCEIESSIYEIAN